MNSVPRLTEYLIFTVFSLLFSAALLVLAQMDRLPLKTYDFIFIVIIWLAAALYRPRYLFWLFLVLLPLETVILSPTSLPVALRPYQVGGGIVIIATVFLWAVRRPSVPMISLRSFRWSNSAHSTQENKTQNIKYADMATGRFLDWTDFAVILLPAIAIATLGNARDIAVSLSLTVVLVTYVALYWLLRTYFDSIRSVVEGIWFFLLGSGISMLFAIYQTVAERVGWKHFSVMPGRINGTFPEPDWLGMFLVSVLALLLWIRWFCYNRKNKIMFGSIPLGQVLLWGTGILLFFNLVILFLTVARSAWFGAVAVIIGYICLLLFKVKGSMQVCYGIDPSMADLPEEQIINVQTRLKNFGKEIVVMGVIGCCALGIVEFGNLSTFHLLNRATSSVSGFQKITVSCSRGAIVPPKIQNIDELSQHGCRHINLEEIETEKRKGNNIGEVLRPDPNVQIRSKIYQTIWQEIKRHPFAGQGWGSSSIILGSDERGAGLNASNIFLETWLSIGLGGFLILLLLIIGPPVYVLVYALRHRFSISTAGAFIILTSGAILVPNLFNAGLLLGFIWIWLAAISVSMCQFTMTKE